MDITHRYTDYVNNIASRQVERQALLSIKHGFIGFLLIESIAPQNLIELYICMFSYYNAHEIELATGLDIDMSGQLRDYLAMVKESITDAKLDTPILRAAVIAAATKVPMVAAWGMHVNRARGLLRSLGAICATDAQKLVVYPPRIVATQIQSAIIAALPQPIYEEILEQF